MTSTFSTVAITNNLAVGNAISTNSLASSNLTSTSATMDNLTINNSLNVNNNVDLNVKNINSSGTITALNLSIPTININSLTTNSITLNSVDLNTRITAIETKNTSQDSNITTNTNNITTNKNNITTNTNNITNLQTSLNSKQNTLVYDNLPTDGSTNMVKSNGIYDFISNNGNLSIGFCIYAHFGNLVFDRMKSSVSSVKTGNFTLDKDVGFYILDKSSQIIITFPENLGAGYDKTFYEFRNINTSSMKFVVTGSYSAITDIQNHNVTSDTYIDSNYVKYMFWYPNQWFVITSA